MRVKILGRGRFLIEWQGVGQGKSLDLPHSGPCQEWPMIWPMINWWVVRSFFCWVELVQIIITLFFLHVPIEQNNCQIVKLWTLPPSQNKWCTPHSLEWLVCHHCAGPLFLNIYLHQGEHSVSTNTEIVKRGLVNFSLHLQTKL